MAKINIPSKKIYQYFHKYQLVLVLVVFSVIQLKYINFVPIWDGRWYMDLLYQAMAKPFNISNYALSGHPAVLYALLLSLTQWIDFGNVYLIHILQILIGLIGIFSFHKILQYIFKKPYSAEIFLLSLIFAIHPVFLANSLTPTLDFPATCFLLAMVASLLYGRLGLFLLFSLLSIFTREIGLSFYLAFVAAYFIANVTRTNKHKKNKNLLVLFTIPVILYGLFIFYKISSASGGKQLWGVESGSPLGLLKLFIKYDFTDAYTLTHLLHVFVVDFSWIFTLFIILYMGKKYGLKLIAFIFNKKFKNPFKPLKIDYKTFFILFFVFIANGIVLFNYATYTNIRYRLPLIPLFLILGLYAFLVLFQKYRKERIFLLSAMVPLFFIQNFYTIDGVSKNFMGTFKFGEHEMLCMTEITREVNDCGRDQKAYNLQYTNIVTLVNKAIQQMDLNKEVNIISHFQTHFFLITNIDKSTKSITLKTKDGNVIKPNLYSFDTYRPHSPSTLFSKLSTNELPSEFYYLGIPDWSDPFYELKRLQQRGYVIKEQKKIEHNGYSIDFAYLKRENNQDITLKPDLDIDRDCIRDSLSEGITDLDNCLN